MSEIEKITEDEDSVEEEHSKDSELISNTLSDIEKVAEKAKQSEPEMCNLDLDKLSEEEELDAYYQMFSDFLKVEADIVPTSGVKSVIPTGIDVLDLYLGGGFIVGAIPMIVGNPGTCKSTLAVQLLGSCQRSFKRSFCLFMDAEEAMTVQRMRDLGMKRPIHPYCDMTIEKVFRTIETIAVKKEKEGIIDEPTVLVWDSIANTQSEKERELNDPDKAIGYKARLLSFLIPKYVAKCSKYNICLLCINQLSDKISMGKFQTAADLRFLPHNKTMSGGMKIKYNCAQLLELKISGILNSDKMGFDGIEMTAKLDKNKLFSPNIPFKLVASYVTGFSNFWTNYLFLIDNGKLIAPKGGWNYLTIDPNSKFRAKEAYNKYVENEAFRKDYMKLVEEVKEEVKNREKVNAPKF